MAWGGWRGSERVSEIVGGGARPRDRAGTQRKGYVEGYARAKL
jgi:hypothetical protein